MSRELSDKDIRILRKLAPECEDMICSGSGVEFRSILPPVANHYSIDESDFRERIERLTPEELEYLVGQIREGGESLSCVPPPHAEVFLEFVSRVLTPETAHEILRIYESADEC
ncbi:MAG: hypothetical protein LUQ25_08625 [Methanoregulaceae archaeon]|nr:hypothetical protein [Methanoregulaceae archaeon]